MKYLKLVKLYEKLEDTSKRLEKTYHISRFLKTVDSAELGDIILLLQGKLFPSSDDQKIGVASGLIVKAIEQASGRTKRRIISEWKKTGDLGETASNLIKDKQQQTLFTTELDTKKVFSNLKKLASLAGSGTVNRKVSLISELLTSAKPIEAKYITRTVLEDLRIGIGEGTLRDALVIAYFDEKIKITYENESYTIDDRPTYTRYADAIQKALDLTNDFGIVARKAAQGLNALQKVSLTLGKPLKVMLAQKVNDAEEGLKRVGTPAECEYKYDGFRLQVHKDKDTVTLFTRRLENVTVQFPDVVKAVKKHVTTDSCILDSEAVGYSAKDKKYLPFQSISQRIRRKYDIDRLAKDFPVELNVFDILYLDKKDLLDSPFSERRSLIEKIIKEKPRSIVLSKKIVTSDEKKVETFYKEAVSEGNEGIMLKKMDAPYKPGSRVGYMVKLKSEKEALDLVIIGAEWGEGKRKNWLSSFTLACIDEDGNFLELGKVGTGIKEKHASDVTFEQLTKELTPLITKEDGRNITVKPKIIVEVAYEEVQKSPNYSSGFALRFPRIKRLRTMERSPEDIASLDMIKEEYDSQKKS